MKKFIYWVGVISLAGCAGTAKTDCAQGAVVDATMNTVMVVTEENDTLAFSTLNADRKEAQGFQLGDTLEVLFDGKYREGMEARKLVLKTSGPLLGGARDEHGCLTSAGYVWSEARQDCVRLFEEGIRLEAADGSNRSAYVVFSRDSLKAELFDSNRPEGSEVLERRTLPSGGHVWNVEDDDTPNLRHTDGSWSIDRIGKRVFRQAQEADDARLGHWQELHYTGTLPAADCPGIVYDLHIRHREHSGDGTFRLQLTYLEAENGKDVSFSYTGRRLTLRGIPSNPDAVVWQLRPDGKDEFFNFLYEDDRTLTLLNRDFERPRSALNYSLKPTE